ncbi:hypothetical protein QCA50_007545 [Cerrena zonata]|uniref:C2H2-type domain-containing protein n=1 Tax=Cerrena zonata TaxID=2478898 RepID=A0AAW0G825_9APHY
MPRVLHSTVRSKGPQKAKAKAKPKHKSSACVLADKQHDHCQSEHGLSLDPPLGFGEQSKPDLQSQPDPRSNTGKLLFWCLTCGETLQQKSDWSRHWKTLHSNIGTFVGCPFCPLKFDRILSNIVPHIIAHFQNDGMMCTERLPSGHLCAETFESPQLWDSHRAAAHQHHHNAYLYTRSLRIDGSRRNLKATHTKHTYNIVYDEFLRGCPPALKNRINIVHPPIKGAVLVFSPAGVPYYLLRIKWRDLLNRTLRANLFSLQTALGHRFCLEELEAIGRRFSPSAPSSQSLVHESSSSATATAVTTTVPFSSYRYPPILPPAKSPSPTPTTTLFDGSPVDQAVYPQECTNTNFVSTPSFTSFTTVDTIPFTSYRYPPIPPPATFSLAATATSVGAYPSHPRGVHGRSRGYTTPMRIPPFPSSTYGEPQMPLYQTEDRDGYTHRYPYAHCSPALSGTSSGLTGAFSSESYSRSDPIPTHTDHRGYSFDSSSISSTPSSSYSLSSPSSSMSPHFDREQSMVRDSPPPRYNGYASKKVSRYSPYF